jgi:hypothetical protein
LLQSIRDSITWFPQWAVTQFTETGWLVLLGELMHLVLPRKPGGY